MPIGRQSVVAIGAAKILGSSNHSSWPGGGFLWYRLLNGDHAGAVVYVAEHLKGLAPAGTRVRAGQQIATALPGYPWTEWGWATAAGQPRALRCYRRAMRKRQHADGALRRLYSAQPLRRQTGRG